jgi:hypothetical protein
LNSRIKTRVFPQELIIVRPNGALIWSFCSIPITETRYTDSKVISVAMIKAAAAAVAKNEKSVKLYYVEQDLI